MTAYRQLVEEAQSAVESQRRAAFDELVRRFRGMAMQQALLSLADSQLAEDAVQEAFLTAYLKIDQLREAEAFPTWLRRIVLSQCDRLIRGKRLQIASMDGDFELAEETASPEQLLEVQELQDQLLYAIDALPEHERAVTQGFYMRGESQQELSERLQVPITTVKKRLQYAREHLRLLVGDINAVFDGAIARVINPPKPQRQPVYLYQQQIQTPDEES